MNILNKLTARQLKKNKRRTLVTIIGVIISVAMVTAVSTLGVSFLDMMKRNTIANDGEWHVLYKNVNKEQLEAIKKDEETKKVVLTKDIGYASLKGSQNESKPYLFIKAYSTTGFKQFPIELSKGRLPTAPNEVVISEAVVSNAKVNYQIGDTLTINVGDRLSNSNEALEQFIPLQKENGHTTEKLKNLKVVTYKITGFIKRPSWEPTWAPGYTIIPYIDESVMGDKDTINASVVVNKVNRSIFTHAEDVAKKIELNKESITYNSGLLRYDGVIKDDNLRTMLFSLSAIIMAVIIVGSVSLIYNSFAISVSERSRHLGMLSSVGATKKQKRNSVFFEGIIIGIISIPIGIICGLAGIYITFKFINSIIHGALDSTEDLKIMVTPLSIFITCAISLLTIFISTYLPALKASRISAMDAIRQTNDVKLTSKAVKTSKFVRKVFGIEAEFGLKNLKRNKRRYRATIFSLVISIVLFLAVSYFTSSLKKSLVLSQDGVNYDIQVSSGTTSNGHLLDSVANLEDVTEHSLMKNIYATSLIDKEYVSKELKEMNENNKSVYEDGKYPFFVRVIALDPASLKTYSRKVGVDVEQLTDPNHLSAIVIGITKYEDEQAKKYVETKIVNMKQGESLDLLYDNQESRKRAALGKVEIAALTDQLPMGVSPSSVNELNLIVSQEVLNQLVDKKTGYNMDLYLYLKSKDPMKTQQDIEEMKEENLSIFNVYQNRQRDEQMLLLMSVFTYGFIALITAISIANIFNTISTSISLRKREFAMLKSVGMTPKGFNKMINYESIFYGINSLLYGLPISIIIMYFIYRTTRRGFDYTFVLPWTSILWCLIAVFIIVSAAMLYSSSKVKKENIIDGLKQENI
ncbi:ABC transporter permease [Heyndrickxia sp. NPDC080065]|uniref:ABC transporter permease n=1 Tax=Heyndrickxia sp. NPDC080065 TaxID=3390568 RepID=UPI003D014268